MRRVAAVIVTSIVLVACGNDGAPTVTLGQIAEGPAEVAAHLTAAEQRWRAHGPDSYVLDYRQVCLCPFTEVTVTVRDAAIVEVVPTDAPQPMDVPAVFTRLRRELERGPDEVLARFDPDTGAPVRFSVDPIENAVDDEWAIEVTLEPGAPVPQPPPTEVAAADLADVYGCGVGFHLGTTDQRLALHVVPTAGHGAVAGPLPDADLPDPAWEVVVERGRHLYANWCDDVLEPGEPTPDVEERWLAVGGALRVLDQPSGAGCGSDAATVAVDGLVVARPDGEVIEVGDVTITNDTWGCYAG